MGSDFSSSQVDLIADVLRMGAPSRDAGQINIGVFIPNEALVVGVKATEATCRQHVGVNYGKWQTLQALTISAQRPHPREYELNTYIEPHDQHNLIDRRKITARL